MPLYEYACQKCGREFEVLQKISDKPLTKCPECKGKLEKLLSQTSFQLKGSGWYVTDYSRSGSGGGSGKSDKADKSDSGKDTKSEKKSEAAAA